MNGIVTKQHSIEISTISVKNASTSSTSSLSNEITITPRPASSNSTANQHTSWLLRFFESKHFDMSIAISYLFNTKEPGVQSYLCNRLFTFANKDVDFYLPQLLNIFIYCCNDSNEQLIAEMLNTYIRSRCSCKQTGIDFSLRCSWLLDAHINDNAKLALTTKESRIKRGLNNAIKLYKLIISEKLRPPICGSSSSNSNNNNNIEENNLKEEEPQELQEQTNEIKFTINNVDCEVKSVDDLDLCSNDANNKEANKTTSDLTKMSHLSTSRSSLNFQNLNYFNNNNNNNNATTTNASSSTNNRSANSNHHHLPTQQQHHRTHNRTKSDTTSSIIINQAINRCNSITSLKPAIGDLMSGRAFENNCICLEKQLQQQQQQQQQANIYLSSNNSKTVLETNLDGIDEENNTNKNLKSSTPSSSSSSYSLSAKDKAETISSSQSNGGNDVALNCNEIDSNRQQFLQPPLQTIKFDCICNAPRLATELEFNKALIHIGKKLIRLSSKELKSIV